MAKKGTHGGRRPGAGRKQKYQSGNNFVGVAIPTKLLDELNYLAETEGVSRSHIIVRLLESKLGIEPDLTNLET